MSFRSCPTHEVIRSDLCAALDHSENAWYENMERINFRTHIICYYCRTDLTISLCSSWHFGDLRPTLTSPASLAVIYWYFCIRISVVFDGEIEMRDRIYIYMLRNKWSIRKLLVNWQQFHVLVANASGQINYLRGMRSNRNRKYGEKKKQTNLTNKKSYWTNGNKIKTMDESYKMQAHTQTASSTDELKSRRKFIYMRI